MVQEAFIPLALAFLALVFLAPIIDGVVQVVEKLMKRIDGMPDYFSDVASFFITAAVGYVICWQGQFDFYAYLNLQFNQHIGWILTAILLSGGTSQIRKYFELANTIPTSLIGIKSAVRRKERRDADAQKRRAGEGS